MATVDVLRRFKIISGDAAALLGPGGARLNSIRQVCLSEISLTCDKEGQGWRVLTITGSQISVADGIRRIEDQMGTKLGPLHILREVSPPKGINPRKRTLIVDQSAAGVLGQHGEKFNSVRAQCSDASISFSGKRSSNRVLQIRGPDDVTDKAI
jgi:hypothetical protein